MNNLSGRTPAFCAGKFARRALQSVVLAAIGRIRLTSLRQDLPPVRFDSGISSLPRNFLFCFALIFSIMSDACATLDSVSPTSAPAWRNSYSGTNYPTQRAAADAACATGGRLFNYYLPWGTDSNGVVTTWQVYCVGIGHQYGGVWQVSAAVCPTPTAQPTIPYAWNPSNGTCERSIVAPCPTNSHGTPPSCVCDTEYKFDAAGTSCVPACPPNASGTPCACNAGYVFDTSGTSCVEQYNITLQYPLADVEPSGTTNIYAVTSRAVYAQVIDRQTGLPKVGAQVKFGVDVIAGTGGHNGLHGVMRPKGKLLDCRDNTTEVESTVCTTQLDGRATVTFSAPIVSGTHKITAECVNPVCAGSASGDINVKVDGLEQIPYSTLYVFVGGEAGKAHTDNHYLTPAASDKLRQLAAAYHKRFPFSAVLRVNDASLVWGGVLDFKGTWTYPHLQHRRGLVIDVRANQLPDAIPNRNDKAFKKIITKELKGGFIFEDSGTPNEHYHILLLGTAG